VSSQARRTRHATRARLSGARGRGSFVLADTTGKDMVGDGARARPWEGAHDPARCPRCGAPAEPGAAGVSPLVMGGNSMAARSEALARFGGLPALPVRSCRAPACAGVGRWPAIVSCFWGGAWEPLEEFLAVPGSAPPPHARARAARPGAEAS